MRVGKTARNATAWANAVGILKELKKYRDTLTIKQMRTIRTMALTDNISGAWETLRRMLKEAWNEPE